MTGVIGVRHPFRRIAKRRAGVMYCVGLVVLCWTPSIVRILTGGEVGLNASQSVQGRTEAPTSLSATQNAVGSQSPNIRDTAGKVVVQYGALPKEPAARRQERTSPITLESQKSEGAQSPNVSGSKSDVEIRYRSSQQSEGGSKR